VIELDDRLRILQRAAREWATELRSHALEVDRDPDAVMRLLDVPVIRGSGTLQIPPEYNPHPLVLSGERFYMMSALERVVALEECAWGDASLMLAAPGAPMAGIVVAALGDEEQKERFFGRLLERLTWACFALSEPARGSDAMAMTTTLTPATGGGFTLNGGKRYVGNAVRAQLAVVFARAGKGPTGLKAVLVDTSASGFKAEPVPTLGLRGAQLGAITLTDLEVSDEQVLGRHLSSTRAGLWAWLRTFNVLRPTVASMGVGMAQAAVDYVRAHRRQLTSHERDMIDTMDRQINAVRHLTRRSAIAVDANLSDGYIASAAKVRASRIAEDVTMRALDFFGPAARLEHPLLEKLARDVRGIEYMEGTTNVQRLSLFNLLARTSNAGRGMGSGTAQGGRPEFGGSSVT